MRKWRKRKWMNLITSLKNTNLCNYKTADCKKVRWAKQNKTNILLKLPTSTTMNDRKKTLKSSFRTIDLKQEGVKIRENKRDWSLTIDDSNVQFTKLWFPKVWWYPSLKIFFERSNLVWFIKFIGVDCRDRSRSYKLYLHLH